MANVLMVTADTTHVAATRSKAAIESGGTHSVTLLAEADLATADLTGIALICSVRATRLTVRSWLSARWAEGYPLLVGGFDAGASSFDTSHTGEDLGLLSTTITLSASAGNAATTLHDLADHPITDGFTPGSDVEITTGENWSVRDRETPAGTVIGHTVEASLDVAAYMSAVEFGGAIYSGGAAAPGGTAPARAAWCGWLYAGQTDYTTDGETLLVQAVDWLTETPQPEAEFAATTSGTTGGLSGTSAALVREAEFAATTATTQGGLSGSSIAPGEEPEAAFAATTSGTTGGLTASTGNANTGTFGGTTRPTQGLIDGDSSAPTVWDTDTRAAGYPRFRAASATVTEDTPVAPPPTGVDPAPVLASILRVPTAVTMSAGVPTVTAMAAPAPVQWGSLRIRGDGRDLSYFRDVRPTVESYELTDPFGWGPATIRFAQVHRLERDNFGSGDLAWVRAGAKFYIDHLDPSGSVTSLIWAGELTRYDFDNDGRLVVSLSGAVSGLLARTQREKRLVRRVRDSGDLLRSAFWYHEVGTFGGFRLTGIDGWLGATGIEQENTVGAGANNLTAVTEILSLAVNDDGQPWTLCPTDSLTPEIDLRLRDLSTVQATIVLGADGVDDNLSTDLMESPNWITGDGVAPNGSRWQGAKYPELTPEESVPFPNTGGAPIQPGDTDADTDSGDGVTVLQNELLASGYMSITDYSTEAGTMGSGSVDAVKALQRSAGLPVTGVVNVATWGAVWSDETQTLRQAYIQPLYSAPEVTQWLYTANGSIAGLNPDFVPGTPRVSRHVSFGAGVTIRQARAYAAGLAQQLAGPDLHGSVTLDADVIEGEWTPAEGDPTPMSRLDIRPWKGLVSLYNPATGTSTRMHVAQASVRDASTVKPVVTLAVDLAGRSYTDLAALRERDQRAKRDPAREWLAQHTQSKTSADRMIGWDSEMGAGLLPAIELEQGWNAFKVPGGQGGTIHTVAVRLSAPVEFAINFTELRVGPGQMQGLIGNPLSAGAEERWEDATEYLMSRGWMGSFGTMELPCGYWPRRKTRDGEPTGAPKTGRFRDDAGWTYKSEDPFFWVQIWVESACSIVPGADSRLTVVLDENT